VTATVRFVGASRFAGRVTAVRAPDLANEVVTGVNPQRFRALSSPDAASCSVVSPYRCGAARSGGCAALSGLYAGRRDRLSGLGWSSCGRRGDGQVSGRLSAAW